MAGKTFKIGRKPENDLVFKEERISGYHAEITPLGNGRFRLEDKGSTNGTFVNKRKIECCEVGYDDIIELAPGSNTRGIQFDLKRYFPMQTPPQPQPRPQPLEGNGGSGGRRPNEQTPQQLDFRQEFLRLEKVYNNYLNEKKRIQKANNKRMMTIRIGASLGVGVLAFGVMFALGDQIDPSTRMLVSPVMMAVTMGVSMLAVNGDDSEIKKLEEWFIESYVCPNAKCRQPLSGPWTMNRLRKKCPYCKALWHD